MAKKRANGEGNIRKRADGRWEGRYTAGYHPETGKRIIKNVLGKTQAECKAKLSAATEATRGVTSYLPYKKGVYFPGTAPADKISVGAERQRRYRAMKRWRNAPTEVVSGAVRITARSK